MSSSVWTATVWGQGKAAILAATNKKIQPGEEECHICKDDVPASVTLRPCGHMVCFGCVENLRAKNIFRADKGVKCPFCRQYVTQYEPCNSADPEQVRLLNEANRAAAFAMAGRAPDANGAAAALRTASAVPVEESWMCNSCRCLNLAHRDECSSCGRANPRPKRATASTRSKDVLKCSEEEIIGYMFERGQSFFARCYSEAGFMFSQGRICTDADTPKRILNAFKQRGEERLMRLVKVLANSETFLEVATHFLGNYGLQTLVEATLKIREASELAAAQGHTVLCWFRSAHNGRDPHAVLLYAALPNAVELSKHELGNFVVQKLADHAEPQELVDLCGAIFPQGPSLVLDHKGVFVMRHLLTMLKKVCSDGLHRFDACELADGLCWHFMEAPDKLKFCLYNTVASQVLAAAVALGLPQYGALQLGSQVASSALRLLSSKNGIACVLSVLEMESIDVMCNELVRDLVCTIAMKLQGSLYGLLMKITCQDDRAPTLVRKLIERLAAEHEDSWLDAICQELVNYGDTISQNQEALDVLKDALCFNVQDDETVVDHITQLRQIVPSKDVMRSLEEHVCNRRDSNPEPPEPRYYAPSFITPSTKYMMARGQMPPGPPPPPPRAVEGAAGFEAAGPSGTPTTGSGNTRRSQQQGGRGGQLRNNISTRFDESYFAEGLFDPAAPVQVAVGTASDADEWGTPSGDPWANVTTGEDWLSSAGCCADVAAPSAPAAAAPAPAPTATVPSTAQPDGQAAGQMLLQSLRRPGPETAVNNGGYAAAPVPPAYQPPSQSQPPVVPQNPPAVLPITAAPGPSRTGLGLSPSLAVNPTLAAARAVAYAAMHARQQAAQTAQQVQQQPQQQQQQQPQRAVPVSVQVLQPQLANLQQQPLPLPSETPAAAKTPTTVELSAFHQPQPQPQQPPQQRSLPHPPIVRTAPDTHLKIGSTYGMGTTAAAPVANSIPYLPPYAPPAPGMPYPMALLNPVLAVLNNTSAISAFAPHASNIVTPRPAVVPVAQVPVAVPVAPQPASLSSAVVQPTGPDASANMSAAAAAPRRTETTASVPARISQTQPAIPAGSLPLPPVADPVPDAAVRGAATTASLGSSPPWQCQICTYEHKGPEAQFLACAICGCERGLQQLPL
ncbi:hypothetical protein VaNZ11_007100 [Volvox africanus]|uniref:RanBP-type and C3HC4-type zinc finger-containing protein 1 n=1 Tax=Volvox africanus TaxID=51714 RepID=A0ABQ5S3F1_9CHLO|nr:hypothetical protein VaNZ11_007100 [Volvox africanus]